MPGAVQSSTRRPMVRRALTTVVGTALLGLFLVSGVTAAASQPTQRASSAAASSSSPSALQHASTSKATSVDEQTVHLDLTGDLVPTAAIASSGAPAASAQVATSRVGASLDRPTDRAPPRP